MNTISETNNNTAEEQEPPREDDATTDERAEETSNEVDEEDDVPDEWEERDTGPATRSMKAKQKDTTNEGSAHYNPSPALTQQKQLEAIEKNQKKKQDTPEKAKHDKPSKKTGIPKSSNLAPS